jgi:hypothetical protein
VAERRTREHTFQIQGFKDRIVVLAVLGLLGGSDLAKIFIPGVGVDNETIVKLEAKIQALDVKMEDFHENLHYEVNILDAKIDETKTECMDYREEDRDEMEALRHRTARLDLLVSQCLNQINPDSVTNGY